MKLSIVAFCVLATTAAARADTSTAGSAAGGGGTPAPSPTPSPTISAPVPIDPATDAYLDVITAFQPPVNCVQCGVGVAPIVITTITAPEALPGVLIPYSDGSAAAGLVDSCLQCGQWIGSAVPPLQLNVNQPSPDAVYTIPLVPAPSLAEPDAYPYPVDTDYLPEP